MSINYEKLYDERDTEALGEYYLRHVDHMTTEKLHGKGDIAAELAYRDNQISNLTEALQEMVAVLGPKPPKCIENCQGCHSEWYHALHIAKHMVEHEVTKKDPLPCICRGNWRNIIHECRHLIGKDFTNDKGEVFNFFGVVHGDDDYYYGFWNKNQNAERKLVLGTCVGSIETNGFKLKEQEQ